MTLSQESHDKCHIAGIIRKRARMDDISHGHNSTREAEKARDGLLRALCDVLR